MKRKLVNDEEDAFIDAVRLCTTRQRQMLFRAAIGATSTVESRRLSAISGGLSGPIEIHALTRRHLSVVSSKES